jgi:hypothetical protein
VDKLRPLINWTKKNRFWIGCVLLSVMMVGIWFWGAKAIDDQTNEFTSKVKSQVAAANGIMQVSAEEGVSAHPNSSTEAGMKQEMKASLNQIIEAWKLRYAAQQSILKWPTEIINNDEFIRAFSKFNPPETFPEKYVTGRGLDRYLDLYRVQIPKQMEHICRDILRTKWNYDPEYLEEKDAPLAAGMGMGMGYGGGFDDFEMMEEYDEMGMGMGMGMGGAGTQAYGPNGALVNDELNRFAVIWDDRNQELWHQKLTRFKGLDDHFNAVEAPTPLQVYMLQQDLWLLEAIFTIIRQINGDADANDLATIKRIDHVALGREARSQQGKLTQFDPRLKGLAPTLGMGDEDMMSDGDFGDFEMDMDMGMGEIDPNAFDKFASYSPYHGRYVDVNYRPLPATLVREVLTATELPEEQLELIVAKRVPVRIALRMDERKIPEFMAACANSPFAIEINQIRINRHQPGVGIEPNGGGFGAGNQSGGGMGMGMGMDRGMGMDEMEMGFDEFDEMGMEMEMGMGMEMGFGSGPVNLTPLIATPVEIRTNYDVNVEFYGIVKIYNPVQESLLRRALGDDGIEDGDAASNTTLDGRSASLP